MVERLRGRAGQRQRERRMRRSDGLCQRCSTQDQPVVATVVDHIKPLALGGSDADENTRNLCDACHDEVTAEQFGHVAGPTIVGTDADGWPAG